MPHRPHTVTPISRGCGGLSVLFVKPLPPVGVPSQTSDEDPLGPFPTAPGTGLKDLVRVGPLEPGLPLLSGPVFPGHPRRGTSSAERVMPRGVRVKRGVGVTARRWGMGGPKEWFCVRGQSVVRRFVGPESVGGRFSDSVDGRCEPPVRLVPVSDTGIPVGVSGPNRSLWVLRIVPGPGGTGD